MLNKLYLALLALCILALCPQTAFGNGILIVDVDSILNLTLDNATAIEPLPPPWDPGVMVTKYADGFTYIILENPTAIGILPPPYEPGVMVTKYADGFTYLTLENATSIGILPPPYEPGVIVTKYADTFMYEVLEPPFITPSFDTHGGTHPSIAGTHSGTIEPSSDMMVTKLYTYACSGTGGHSKSIALYENDVLLTSGMWKGYGSDWHNITLTPEVTLQAGHTYNYTIVTGAYPQIIHASSKGVTGGTITCTGFEDINGKQRKEWIPAIKLY